MSPNCLRDLAAAYGTPLYVYDLAEVRRAASRLLSALPEGVHPHYSLKANPHWLITRELSQAGVYTEISSQGELAALERAGVPRLDSLYTGPGKTPTELVAAVRSGVRTFSVESVVDRDRLAEVSAAESVDLRYLIRANGSRQGGGGGLHMTGVPSQFGVPLEDEPQLKELSLPRGRTRPVGVHVFSASNIADFEALAEEFANNLAIAARVTRITGVQPELLDLGGGFPAPFAARGDPAPLDGLRERLTTLLDRELPSWRTGRPTIAFESGRALVATSGTLVTRVMDVKSARGQTYVIVDGGVNTLGGMSGLGRLLAPNAQPICLGPAAASGAPITATLVGPLCTPLDVHNRRATLEGTQVGELLAIPNTGAYGLTASLVGFLSRPIAPEVVVDDGVVVHARSLTLTETEVPL